MGQGGPKGEGRPADEHGDEHGLGRRGRARRCSLIAQDRGRRAPGGPAGGVDPGQERRLDREPLREARLDGRAQQEGDPVEPVDAEDRARFGPTPVQPVSLVPPAQLASAAERMVADGKHELAAAVLRWAQPRFASSARLEAVCKLAYLRLMEKYQEFNPFKFILYSGEIEEFTPQINAPLVPTTSMPGTVARGACHASAAECRPSASPLASRSARDRLQSLRRTAAGEPRVARRAGKSPARGAAPTARARSQAADPYCLTAYEPNSTVPLDEKGVYSPRFRDRYDSGLLLSVPYGTQREWRGADCQRFRWHFHGLPGCERTSRQDIQRLELVDSFDCAGVQGPP